MPKWIKTTLLVVGGAVALVWALSHPVQAANGLLWVFDSLSTFITTLAKKGG